MAQTKKQAEGAVGAAAKQVTEARAILQKWHTALAGARDALTGLESESGAALLDDPEKAAQWPSRVREARDAVTVAERAVAAQEPRVTAAEREWCRAHAALLEVVEVVPARQEVAQHEARTAELLAALEEHDGPYVPAARAARSDLPVAAVGGMRETRLPKSTLLQHALARVTVRHQVLVAMGEGEDPATIVAATAQSYAADVAGDDCYPEPVRPGGLVPAPVFRQRELQLRELVRELESLPQVMAAEVADLEEQNTAGMVTNGALETARAWNAQRLEELPDELEAARSRLAALVGEAAGS